MPVYEYECPTDGTVIELIRPMNQADAPVQDPEGKGRTFRRRQSTFSTGKAGPASTSLPFAGGCCPCGKNKGACGSSN